MESKHAVKMPGVGRGNNPASHCNLQRGKKEQKENEEPQYGVLPCSINVVSCSPMAAFLLQDPGPWVALQATMDGSGELRA